MKEQKIKGISLILLAVITICLIAISPVAAGPPGPNANMSLFIPDYVYPTPQAPPVPGSPPALLPVHISGTRPLLVILYEASDVAHSAGHDVAFYTDLVNGGRPDLNTYWTEVSYGTFNGYTPLTVVDWHTSTLYTRAQIAAYPPASPNVRDAVRDAIAIADPHINYATYDTNADGTVTNDELTIMVITSGVGGDHGGSAVWSHHWQAGTVTADGKTIEGEYSITAEDNPMGTWAHEFGHDLELPDLYDTTPSSSPDSEGIGHYGLMGSGSWCGPTHPVAYHKWLLGWLTPTTISTAQCIDVTDVETHPVAYLVQTGVAGEFFMVENRWRGTSYDSVSGTEGMLNDQGLLITHIDQNTYNAKWANNDVNGAEEHKAVDVETAEHATSHSLNVDDLDTSTNRGDSDDFWDNTEYAFTDASAPCAAIRYSGANSGVSIATTSAPAATMRVCFFGATDNHPPVAAFSNAPYCGRTGLGAGAAISMSGAASSDPDAGDSIALWEWTWDDGSPVTGSVVATTTHNYGAANYGLRTVQLRVQDTHGAWSTPVTTTCSVNAQPVAVPGGPYSGQPSVAITFDGSGSTDAYGGLPLQYRWDWENDGAYDTGWLDTPTTTHTYTSAGAYTVGLQVRDNFVCPGSTRWSSTKVTTTATLNTPPVAEANGPYTASINQVITFSSAGSYDPDPTGSIVAYAWNWGDGTPNGAGPSPTHAYTTSGTKTVILTVTDNMGATGTDTATVNVLTVCQSIQALKDTVKSMTLSPTIRTALNTRLNKASTLCAGGPSKYPAIVTLFKNDFKPYVNSKIGRGITPAQAITLNGQADIIIVACGGTP